jgi:hypothetical protein
MGPQNLVSTFWRTETFLGRGFTEKVALYMGYRGTGKAGQL